MKIETKQFCPSCADEIQAGEKHRCGRLNPRLGMKTIREHVKVCPDCHLEYKNKWSHRWECLNRKEKPAQRTPLLPNGFTQRQEDVRKLLEAGKKPGEIAREFGVSEAAIWASSRIIREKLHRLGLGDAPVMKRLPSGFTEHQKKVKEMREQGLTVKEIAGKFGVSTSAVQITIRAVNDKLRRMGSDEVVQSKNPREYPAEQFSPKEIFEKVRRKLLAELRRRTFTAEMRSQLSSEELSVYLKLCRENIAQEMDYSDAPEGKPIQLIHNMPVRDERPLTEREIDLKIMMEREAAEKAEEKIQ